jgi:hypothetical protein
MTASQTSCKRLATNLALASVHRASHLRAPIVATVRECDELTGVESRIDFAQQARSVQFYRCGSCYAPRPAKMRAHQI